ncbi:hypothetical protein PC128_g10063 [Phytophthora cactorum]|nr:hypothetical protein PC128_g10063 [Phytophthora cactorum]
MEDKLRRELQQLSPAQLRELLNASGHGQLLADEKPAVDEQLVAETKNEGNAFFRQGRLHDAVSSYSRCIEMDPNNAVCLSNRAAAFLKQKEFNLAVADCSKALEVAPTIKPFMRRATAFIALEQYKQAVTDLTAALELEPRNKECCAKLQAIVDAAIAVQQRGNGANAELRRAGVRAAAIFSVREGWSKSAVRGNPGPAAVNGHTLFRGDNGRIYLFGGRAAQACLHRGHGTRLQLSATRAASSIASTAECRHEDLKEIPAPRSGHAVVSIVEDNGDRIVFMFGGRTKRGVSDQLLILRLSTIRTGSNAHDSVDATVAWEEVGPEAGSAWPSARDGHSMCLIPSTGNRTPRLIVFGGNGQLNDDRMNDVWLFDVEKQLWTLLQCSGDIPPPRSYHTAHTVGEFLFVVGGRTAESEDGSVYMLDIGATEWFKVSIPSDHTLPPRAWHSSVLTKAGELFVLGGGTYHGPLKDAATLDLSYFHLKAPSLMQ